MSKLTSENLRFLLWRQGVPRARWADYLAEWAGCSKKRANELIAAGTLRSEEQQAICQNVGCTEDELQFARLVEQYGIDVLSENLRFLMENLEHGEKRKFALGVGVGPVTVARWSSGAQIPQQSRLGAIIDYFCLPKETDLTEEPIFLSSNPVGPTGQRAWLHGYIDKLDNQSLQSLFPALRKLLDTNETD